MAKLASKWSLKVLKKLLLPSSWTGLNFLHGGGGGVNFAFVWENWKILDFALEISNPLCLVLAIMSMQKSCLQQT